MNPGKIESRLNFNSGKKKLRNAGFESGFWNLNLDINFKFRLKLSFDCLNLVNSGVYCHLISFWLYSNEFYYVVLGCELYYG